MGNWNQKSDVICDKKAWNRLITYIFCSASLHASRSCSDSSPWSRGITLSTAEHVRRTRSHGLTRAWDLERPHLKFTVCFVMVQSCHLGSVFIQKGMKWINSSQLQGEDEIKRWSLKLLLRCLILWFLLNWFILPFWTKDFSVCSLHQSGYIFSHDFRNMGEETDIKPSVLLLRLKTFCP